MLHALSYWCFGNLSAKHLQFADYVFLGWKQKSLRREVSLIKGVLQTTSAVSCSPPSLTLTSCSVGLQIPR